MHYLGGKSRLGEAIAQFVRANRRSFQQIIEPFCGAGWVTQHLFPGPVTAADISAPLIEMHKAVQDGWEPPEYVSEEEYAELHQRSIDGEINEMIGFVGYGCSWGGKWWGGYARGDGRNHCDESRRSLLKKHGLMKHVDFKHLNYKSHDPEGCLIYCDPPYAGTTGYESQWDAITFWETVRKWSENNTVIVSEYIAPADFRIAWSMKHFSFKGLGSSPTDENLFMRR